MVTKRVRKVAASAAVLMLGGSAALGVAAGASAGADPKQLDKGNFVGVGSDTTQEVLNAFAGFVDTLDPSKSNFVPLQSAGGKKQILSFDALFKDGENLVANTCIETRTGFGAMYRPNGSSEGRRALSRAFGGGGYGIPQCGGLKNIAGMVDFARSSAGPPGPGNDLVYIPFGRDALSFAYYLPASAGSPVTVLSKATITSLYTTGPQVVDGRLIVACGIQAGSGTYQSWNTMNAIPTTEVGSALCNGLGGTPNPDGRVQENKTEDLKSKGDLIQTVSDPACDGVAGGPAVSCAGAQVIAGFSASGYIASGNGVSSVPFAPEVKLGGIAEVGGGVIPVTGTPGNFSAVAAFYNDANYGRDVYNVLPRESVEDIGNIPLQSMFVGPTSKICTDGASRITAFGYLTLGPNCGSTTLRGAFLSGSK